jgi:hypothetical protein
MHRVTAAAVMPAAVMLAAVVAVDMAADTDTVVDTVAIMARVTDLAHAFRYRCP